MDDEKKATVWMASIEQALDRGSPLSNETARWLLEQLRTAEAERDGETERANNEHIAFMRADRRASEAKVRAAEAEAEVATLRQQRDEGMQAIAAHGVSCILITTPNSDLAERYAADRWDEGWDAGNEYALSEPFDGRSSRESNPYRAGADHE